jgi:hypothetical protein
MVNKAIREFRCDDVLKSFTTSKTKAVFFTLTTADSCGLSDIRSRWRSFRNFIVRKMENDGYGRPAYVMNYEMHPGVLLKVKKDGSVYRGTGLSHGWHIHGVFDRFVPLCKYFPDIRSHGFSRVDFRVVNSRGVSWYLTKHALKAYRGVSSSKGDCVRLRLVNTSRGLPRLSDYNVVSEFRDGVKALLSRFPETGFYKTWGFVRRFRACQVAYMMGVRERADLHYWLLKHF